MDETWEGRRVTPGKPGRPLEPYCKYGHPMKGENLLYRTIKARGYSKGGVRRLCRSCYHIRGRNGGLRRRYGMTTEEFNIMHNAQKGVCGICHEPETETHNGKLKLLSVDHNHKTGQIRGLLCNQCNGGLAKFKDNVKELEAAAEYLR